MIGVIEQQNLLSAVSQELKHKVVVYAIGGTAMMFHNFKDVTRDIDLVFLSNLDKDRFKTALRNIGYDNYSSVKVYGVKENQPDMLTRGTGKEERFDLFMREIISFTFSDEMIRRAKATYEFGEKLIIKIADPHDIILMKCATDRIKDKDDARTILSSFTINWDIIIDEAINQEKNLNKPRAIFELTGFIYDLRKTGVKIPPLTIKRLEDLLSVSLETDVVEDQTKLDSFSK